MINRSSSKMEETGPDPTEFHIHISLFPVRPITKVSTHWHYFGDELIKSCMGIKGCMGILCISGEYQDPSRLLNPSNEGPRPQQKSVYNHPQEHEE